MVRCSDLLEYAYISKQDAEQGITAEIKTLDIDDFNISSKSDLLNAMYRIMLEFPTITEMLGNESNKEFIEICNRGCSKKYKNCKLDKIQLCKHISAHNSYRGLPTVQYSDRTIDIYFYQQNRYADDKIYFDAPVFILEYQGKYAVVKHPNFEHYGFIVKK